MRVENRNGVEARERDVQTLSVGTERLGARLRTVRRSRDRGAGPSRARRAALRRALRPRRDRRLPSRRRLDFRRGVMTAAPGAAPPTTFEPSGAASMRHRHGIARGSAGDIENGERRRFRRIKVGSGELRLVRRRNDRRVSGKTRAGCHNAGLSGGNVERKIADRNRALHGARSNIDGDTELPRLSATYAVRLSGVTAIWAGNARRAGSAESATAVTSLSVPALSRLKMRTFPAAPSEASTIACAGLLGSRADATPIKKEVDGA